MRNEVIREKHKQFWKDRKTWSLGGSQRPGRPTVGKGSREGYEAEQFDM